MKRILLKTFYFSLPIILVGLCMEVLLRNVPNDYLYKREYLDMHSNEIETLIMGSSHAFYGFDPIYFSSETFNASHISQSLNYDFEIYRKYQNDFNNLKTIILPISYFTLWGKLENSEESWRVKNYSLYYKIKTSGSVIDNTELFSNKFGINIKRLYLYYIKKQESISCSEFGWGTAYESENSKDLIETGEIAAKRHTIMDIGSEKNASIFNENIEILNSIIALSKKRNVKIIFITLPAYKTYTEGLNEGQKAKTIEAIMDIEQKNNCVYLNLLEDQSFVSTDFYDADHLNEFGAKKISILLRETMDL